MKRIYTALFIALAFISCVTMQAQDKNKTITIGNTEITLQSPLTVGPKNSREDSIKIFKETESSKYHSQRYWYKRKFVKFYLGFGFAADGSFSGEQYMPVYFGPSIEFQTGLKLFYRPCRWYAIGTKIQYSYNNYKLRDAAANDKIVPNPYAVIGGTPFAEYYRTDNIGTAWLNRFYVNRRIYLELGLYGDWIMSKRYIVKTRLPLGEEISDTYRSDDLFSSFQAGAEASIGYGVFSIYAKYRFTDLFYRDKIEADPIRLNLGVMFSF